MSASVYDVGVPRAYLSGIVPSEKAREEVSLAIVHLREIEQLFWRCRVYLNNFNGAVQRRAEGTALQAFLFLEGFIEAAARMCLHVWPAPRTFKKSDAGQMRLKAVRDIREEHVRGLLGVDAAGGAFKCITKRQFRHDIAHLDERLDEWYRDSVHKNLSRHGLVSHAEIMKESGLPLESWLSVYEMNAKVYWFAGKSLDVQALTDDAAELNRRAQIAVLATDKFIMDCLESGK